MKFRVFGGVAVAIAGLVVTRDAAAAAPALDAGTGTSGANASASAIETTNDVPSLIKLLDKESSALSTSDCGVACRALASIRRAADKICALEPGPRCDSARDKATEATKRVREACPDCSQAMGPSPTERAATEASPPSPADSPAKVGSAPAESERGGCKSCSSALHPEGSNTDVALIALTVLAVMRLSQRKKKK